MCGHHAILPRALKIPVCYDRTRDALYRGGFADVWKGEHGGREVAVKVLRTYSNSDFKKIVGVSSQMRFLLHANPLTECHTEVLQGGCDVENPPASEYSAADRSEDV